MSKRARADVDGMTSAGLTVFNKDETYFTTNVSNMSLYDSNYQHGIAATFTQNRTVQIIPNTSRSEVGIAYAEIQTKSLPVFQPQVKIGSDPDALIYEVGMSCQWSGGLLDPITKGARIPTLLDSDVVPDDVLINGTGRLTFQNDSSGSITVVDSYKNSFTVPLLGATYTETLLSQLFSSWRAAATSTLYLNSPLIPVVVGSVYQPSLVVAPLLNSVPSVIGAYIAIASAEGFKVGDRVRVFGGVDSGALTTKLNKYTTVLGVCLYSDLVVSGGAISPTSNSPVIMTTPVLVVDNSSTGLNLTSTSSLFKGGYVVNCTSDSRGGTIQFLVDEYEFKPLTVTPTATTSNLLTVNLPGSAGVTAGEGFLRTDGTNRFKGVVEIRSTATPKINGLYKVASVTSTTSMTLTPLTYSLDTVSSFTGTATLSLAPNAYTFDASISRTLPTSAAQKNAIRFARYVGLHPTHTFEPLPATYPPTATVAKQSWRRAYTVDFTLSAYRNVRWVTQDIAPVAAAPLVQQDFGDGSTSTYYNVYDIKRFLSQCVNPAFQQCLESTDEAGYASISDLSLESQLKKYATGYQAAFTSTNATLAYNPASNYAMGVTVIYNFGIYMTIRAVTGNLNIIPTQTDYWVYLGKQKVESSTTSGDLVWSSVTGGLAYSCVGVTMQPERVHLADIPKFKTKPPQFTYDTWSNLFSMELDTYSFGDTYPYGYTTENGLSRKNDLNFNFNSWGYQNATGEGGEEYFNVESNSPFKFLFDNFSCEAISYVNPATNDILAYWVWSAYHNSAWIDALENLLYRIFTQSAESMTSCVCPVQTIVVISRTIPVVNSLASPPVYVSDFNTSIVNLTGVVGDSDSIVGEFSIYPGMLNSSKSVIRYQPDEVSFYSLQSTKIFKQLDYTVCYRHRITQKLVPLILSNYGNVNIKFVFKPT